MSKLPDHWQVTSLGSITTRVRRRNTVDNSNVLTISAKHGLVGQKQFFNKIVASTNLSNYFLLEEGEFAYNKSYSNGYPVGVVRKLKLYDKGVLSPLYICFSVSNETVDSGFLEQLFDSQWFIDEINQIAKEGARNHGLLNVGISEFFSIEVPQPPLPEQKKIAAILTSVDDVIEKTQAQIDKLKDLKTGMMQELLMRGVGVDGKPHTEFKEIPKWTTGRIADLKEIPSSWELVNINDVAKLESGHTPSRDKPEYWGGSFQWVSLHDTKQLHTPIINKTKLTITQSGLDNSSARLLPIGTIAFSRTASVGHCVMFGEKMATSQDFANYVCGDKLSPRYVLQLFRWMQHVWSQLAEGSTHKTIYMPVFKKLHILLPPLNEQVLIADIAESIDKKILMVSDKLESNKKLKKALMQDLLTGKVRVKVDS